MSQFSWTKAFLYALVCLIGAVLLQAYVVLPGALRWVNEERRRRDQARITEEYRLENARLLRTIQELQRQLRDRDEALRAIEEREKRSGPARSRGAAGRGKGN